MPTLYQGQCACKAVQYQLQGEPLFAQYCHCNKCRDVAKDSQNAKDKIGYSYTAAYLTQYFQVTQGESELDELPKNNALLFLCKHCHTLIYGWSKDPDNRDGLGVNANTISDVESLRPFKAMRHVYFADKKSDVSIQDTLPKFADMPKELGGTGQMVPDL